MIRNSSPPCPRAFCAGAALAAALAAGCTPAATPPPADASSNPTFGADDMPPGTHVQVARSGQWWPAVVLQPMGEGRVLIHYDNAGSQYDEIVGPDRLKTLPGAGPGGAAARDYSAGEKVLVTYQNRLLLGDIVMQVGAQSWRVHYDGFGPEAAENVGPDRLRRPFTGPSGHAVGESVTVDVNGQQLAAKILAASASDHWVVRFDAYGPQYDQEVGLDRIRAAAVTPPPHPAPVVAAVPAPPAPPPGKGDKPGVKVAVVEKPKPPKPPPPTDVAPTVPAGPPSVGENVLVSVRGAWFPAMVSNVGAGTFKVKYTSGAEEDVPAAHLLREPAGTKGLHYQPTQLVVVNFKGVYIPGKVIRQEGKSDYRVRFDGMGPEGDEVVPSLRIHPR